MSYFHWKYNQLSSALKCFTVLFGMGRRGSTTLWSPGNLEFFQKRNEAGCVPLIQKFSSRHKPERKKLHGYRIKLHEQLVSVSSTPHSAYTPDLSTS